MKKNWILSILIAICSFHSYSQKVTYSDLIGSTYAWKDPGLEGHSARYFFKDSLHVDLLFDEKVLNLTYKLDPIKDATLITMKKDKNNRIGPPVSYALLKKADGSNLKMQLNNIKPTVWDSNETNNNTVLLMPVGMVYAPARVSKPDSTIYFKEFGWTIKLPSDFKIRDTAEIKVDSADKKIIEQAAGVHLTITKIILISARRDQIANFLANYSASPYINIQNWESIDSASKQVLIRSMDAQIHLKGVSSNSDAMIDGVGFKKFQIDYNMNDSFICHVVCFTSFYKGRYFTISYSWSNDDTALADMISNSKFDK